MTEVAVLIVCYNGRAVLADCLDSVLASDDSPLVRHVLVVDNASSDGSADEVALRYPAVDLLRLTENRGFAGGNNAGWDWLRKNHPNVEYVALLNQDTRVRAGWLRALVEYLEHRPVVGAAQAKIMLWPQADRINTAGNRSHYLGFGFTTAGGEVDRGQFDQPREIDFTSGAAMIVRADAIRRAGLFDDDFFLYLEDADLGWKLRQMGYRMAYVPSAVVWHQYAFRGDFGHYFHLERNRWLLLATYYKTPTLLLLLPAIAAMEIGQFLFAWRHRLLGRKWSAWNYFLNLGNISRLLRRRAAAQSRRNISDREFTAGFLSRIESPELPGALLERLGNPFLAACWAVTRRVMFW